MGKSHRKETSEFCLEGRFLEFVIKDGYKLKGLLLGTSEGDRYIKLAKHLRHGFDLRLPPGTWLQIVGEKKYDSKTGEVKLKAERVMACLKEVERREEVLPTSLRNPKKRRKRNRLKSNNILVCQKSSCMKRGGQKAMSSYSCFSERTGIRRSSCYQRYWLHEEM